MNTAHAHYDELLGGLYPWMMGDFAARVAAQTAWLRGVVEYRTSDTALGTRQRALDLGAGAGAESIALVGLGFDVVAVEANRGLCGEIRARASLADVGPHVEVVEKDLIDYLEGAALSDERVSLAVCIGDTLTHLDTPDTVQRMFRSARACIADGGRLVVSWRDLSNELRGTDRFFLVRADDSRILTCFVEYFPNHVAVHDIFHERTESGWAMRKSSYPKLRLPAALVREWLARAGFDTVEQVPCAGGLTALVAR